MVYDWRDLLDDFQKTHGGDERFIMLEAHSTVYMVQRFYGSKTRKGAQMPFNFGLLRIKTDNLTHIMNEKIHNWYDSLVGTNYVSNWVVSNLIKLSSVMCFT